MGKKTKIRISYVSKKKIMLQDQIVYVFDDFYNFFSRRVGVNVLNSNIDKVVTSSLCGALTH